MPNQGVSHKVFRTHRVDAGYKTQGTRHRTLDAGRRMLDAGWDGTLGNVEMRTERSKTGTVNNICIEVSYSAISTQEAGNKQSKGRQEQAICMQRGKATKGHCILGK